MRNKLHSKSYNQLKNQLFDKPCEKCGTIISFSKGIVDCPRCSNITVEEQIELHKMQAQEYTQRRKMGFIFLGVFAIIFSAVVLFLI